MADKNSNRQKRQTRYQVTVDGDSKISAKTRRQAELYATSLTHEYPGAVVDVVDTMPPEKKSKSIEGEGFIMDNVVDPYDISEKKAVKRVRLDAIGEMFKRGQISQSQKLAADRYEKASIVSSGQSNGAIDYSAVKVDTTCNPDASISHRLDGNQDSINAAKLLNEESRIRVETIVCNGANIKQYCAMVLRKKDRRTHDKQMNLFREDLTALAVLWNYESKARAAA